MFRNMAKGSEEIGRNLKAVLQKVKLAAEQRSPELPSIEPRLVAATKTKHVGHIVAAYQNGQRHFGENYVNELAEKSTHSLIRENCKDIRWHFIGHLQRNKANKVAVVPNLYMVETVDNHKLAQTLSNLWEKFQQAGQLRVLVQVNTSGEDNKSGCNPADVKSLVAFVREKCPRLQFCGLMTIGAIGYDPMNGPNPDFLHLVECRKRLSDDLAIPMEKIELSMGMSSDYEHAISLGSTNVRVGSTIFGARDYPNQPTVVPLAAALSEDSGNVDRSQGSSGDKTTSTSASNQSQGSSDDTTTPTSFSNQSEGSSGDGATPTSSNNQLDTFSNDQQNHNIHTESVFNSIGELSLDSGDA